MNAQLYFFFFWTSDFNDCLQVYFKGVKCFGHTSMPIDECNFSERGEIRSTCTYYALNLTFMRNRPVFVLIFFTAYSFRIRFKANYEVSTCTRNWFFFLETGITIKATSDYVNESYI